MRFLLAPMLIAITAGAALAANSPAPTEFGGIALGASLHELKARYPDASRNPDSDRQFQVYQVPALHDSEVKSPGAFQIYQGRVVGGQILLDSHTAQHWLDTMTARYGKPDSCTYCNDPESATAVWHWDNGTMLKIEAEMLTELTKEGAAQRSAWLARGDSSDELADNGDESTDEGAAATGPVTRKHTHRAQSHAAASSSTPQRGQPSGWRAYYNEMNTRLEHWLGWSK